ncbi:MAG: xanthine dehydrogenase family protein molybdopterin-binding subunit, partial [Planctomycetes bacterium]|nr:xanthine dehydrogenase family protein molybdopterin-binding subunit [Planctomycetota bacterium]
MSDIVNLSRRRFLRMGALAGGGLILGVNLPGCTPCSPAKANAPAAVPPAGEAAACYDPNAIIRIGTDESVTIVVTKAEMGQGTYTSLPMIVAEELDADWSKVRVEGAPVAPVYTSPVDNAQGVGGSSSIRNEYEPLARTGAMARAMLVAAAAAEWKVDPKTCRTENGHVLHADGRKLSYGKLAEAASRIPPPKAVTLKDPKDYKLVGRPTKRLDSLEKTNGKALFGIDVQVPGMLVALVARPPVFGGKMKSFDDSKTKAVPGVRHVVAIDRGVAVVADSFWPASLGIGKLEVVWEDGPLAAFDSEAQPQQYEELAKQPGIVAEKEGDVEAGLAGAARKFEATYWFPYLAHAPMETLNCVADVRPDACELWTGTENQTLDRDLTAKECGLKPEQVKLNTMFLGGGFGRRAADDSHFVLEAVQVSKAVKAPVKVIWRREDDIRGGFYRPSSFHRVEAGLDPAGKP